MSEKTERVIRALECCIVSACEECPYGKDCMPTPFDPNPALRDALELLEEREPIKPNEYDPVIYGTRYTCGACKHKIYRNENYCHNCGRPVKWDG